MSLDGERGRDAPSIHRDVRAAIGHIGHRQRPGGRSAREFHRNQSTADHSVSRRHRCVLDGPKRGSDVFPNRLEADLFPHLVASQNFSSTLDVVAQSRRGVERFKEFSYSISGTPAVRLRMLRAVSAPVRTPSYMPRVNAQFLWTRGLKDCDPSNPKAECRATAARSGSGSGQDGLARTLRRSQAGGGSARERVGGAHHRRSSLERAGRVPPGHADTRPPTTGECVPPGTLTAETINRRDGSFSTNYIRTGINYSRNWMESNLEADARGSRASRGRASPARVDRR